MFTHCLAFRQLSNSKLIIPWSWTFWSTKLYGINTNMWNFAGYQVLRVFRAMNELTKQSRLHWVNYPLSWPYLSHTINHTLIHMLERNGIIFGTTSEKINFTRCSPTSGCWPLSCRRNRREELVLSRIRIGHSYLTHLGGRQSPGVSFVSGTSHSESRPCSLCWIHTYKEITTIVLIM